MTTTAKPEIGYVNIDCEIIFNQDITIPARITYMILAEYCQVNKKDTVSVSLETIGEKVGRSPRSIIRYIKELIDAGLVRKINRGHHSNEYTLKGLIKWDEVKGEMVKLN